MKRREDETKGWKRWMMARRLNQKRESKCALMRFLSLFQPSIMAIIKKFCLDFLLHQLVGSWWAGEPTDHEEEKRRLQNFLSLGYERARFHLKMAGIKPKRAVAHQETIPFPKWKKKTNDRAEKRASALARSSSLSFWTKRNPLAKPTNVFPSVA